MMIIVMGVSGCGKTTIGEALAERLGWLFFDADDFHPPANVLKMSQGIPLTDEDRWPWLEALQQKLSDLASQGKPAVLACSALKQSYRDVLSAGRYSVQYVYLRGDFDLIWKRMQARHGHYMPPDLLSSQFAALEEPGDALVVDISKTPSEIVNELLKQISSMDSKS